ncbi:MAG: GGDEF domain-containing protein [Gammaproteobacteria bacterium]|jgi:diguanylate cyclase (GGDEF)-like protein|nr:MAG: GGDEF domain-containing protein [Gammaproteobacteria bacterium]
MTRLILPAILLVSAIVFRGYAVDLPPEYGLILRGLPWVVIAITLALTVWFNRSLQCSAALVLLMTLGLVNVELQSPLNQTAPLAAFGFLSVTVPVCLLLIISLPERGLRSVRGILVGVIAPGIMGLGYGLLKLLPGNTVFESWVSAMPVRPWPGYILSWQASILFGCTLLIGLLLRRRHDGVIPAIIVLSAVFLMLALFDRALISTFMICAAGLGLIIVLLQGARDLAYRDELTGLPGRRALNERLKGLGKQYVIAMLDVDHFKKFNDTHGHDMGDEVLKMVARHIARIKGGGLPYRFGGEEFCVVFPGRDIEYSHPFLEQLRSDIENYSMSLRNHAQRPRDPEQGAQRRGRRAGNRGIQAVSVTISIGLAEPNENGNTPAVVMKAADTALYRAKKNGRNCLAW